MMMMKHFHILNSIFYKNNKDRSFNAKIENCDEDIKKEYQFKSPGSRAEAGGGGR